MHGRRTTAAAALAILPLTLLLPACGRTDRTSPSASPGPSNAGAQPTPIASPTDPFDAWFETDFPAADGFDPWNSAPGNVRAVAHGRVASASGETVAIDHVFYENHERRQIRSVYEPVAAMSVRAGDVVKRGDRIGGTARVPTDLRLELSDKARTEPASFIRSHRRLPVPQDEPALLLVSSRQRTLRLRLDGRHVGDFEVGFGQQEGRKRQQHDLRTPLGMYFVVAKSRGPFPGAYGSFYGGHWIKVNYPNAYDAAWARQQGLLTTEETRDIAAEWWKRRPTLQGTPLGGGIGFHGWADDWDLDGPRRLSWGCVVMRNADIERLFDRIPVGAMVVIL
jgi:L,D-transpeptidase catalytic domain